MQKKKNAWCCKNVKTHTWKLIFNFHFRRFRNTVFWKWFLGSGFTWICITSVSVREIIIYFELIMLKLHRRLYVIIYHLKVWREAHFKKLISVHPKRIIAIINPSSRPVSLCGLLPSLFDFFLFLVKIQINSKKTPKQTSKILKMPTNTQNSARNKKTKQPQRDTRPSGDTKSLYKDKNMMRKPHNYFT